MARILLVTADSSFNLILTNQLNKIGHKTVSCLSCETAINEYKLSRKENRTFQIIIINQTIPAKDGFTIEDQNSGEKLIHKIKRMSALWGIAIQSLPILYRKKNIKLAFR